MKFVLSFTSLLVFVSLSLGPECASAEVSFVTYLKRNHQILNKNRTPSEKIAFKEKQRYLASEDPKPESKAEPKAVETPANEDSPAAGPNQ